MSGVAVIELEQKASTLVEQARSLKVNNQQTYDLAAERLLAVADLRRQIERHHAPLKKAAHASWQQVIAAEKKLLDPVSLAEKLYKASLATYESEQRRRDAERYARAEAEAQRLAEEQRERELAQAEAEGADIEEIEAMVVAPLVVAPPRVEPGFQKVKGVNVAVSWRGVVTSLEALVKGIASGKANLNLVTPNETAINQLARATRGTLTVPGVRFFDERVVRAARK